MQQQIAREREIAELTILFSLTAFCSVVLKFFGPFTGRPRLSLECRVGKSRLGWIRGVFALADLRWLGGTCVVLFCCVTLKCGFLSTLNERFLCQ